MLVRFDQTFDERTYDVTDANGHVHGNVVWVNTHNGQMCVHPVDEHGNIRVDQQTQNAVTTEIVVPAPVTVTVREETTTQGPKPAETPQRALRGVRIRDKVKKPSTRKPSTKYTKRVNDREWQAVMRGWLQAEPDQHTPHFRPRRAQRVAIVDRDNLEAMPQGTEILDSRVAYKVTHPDLPIVPDGERIPELSWYDVQALRSGGQPDQHDHGYPRIEMEPGDIFRLDGFRII